MHSAPRRKAQKPTLCGAGGGESQLLERKRALRANHRAHESPFYAPLGHIGPRGGLNLSSLSTSAKVNRLVIRYLHFWSVRGDLLEGHGYGKHLAVMVNFSTITFPDGNSCLHSANSCLPGPLSHPPEHKIGIIVRCCQPKPPFSGIPSTKSRFLCAFGVWNPCFQAFRAQNRDICAFLGSATPVFRPFKQKIETSANFEEMET